MTKSTSTAAVREYFEQFYNRSKIISGERHLKERYYRMAYSFVESLVDHKRVLEVGCGTGGFTNLLSAIGGDSVGIDFSDRAVRIAKAKYSSSSYLVADAQHLPFRKGAFDIVVSCETIEHVPDYEMMFADLLRVLTDDGVLCLTTNNLLNFWVLDWWVERVLLGRNRWALSDQPEHLFHYFKVAGLCRRHGADLITFKSEFFEPPLVNFMSFLSGLFHWLDVSARNSFLRFFGLNIAFLLKKNEQKGS